jgi:hypothetical protein
MIRQRKLRRRYQRWLVAITPKTPRSPIVLLLRERFFAKLGSSVMDAYYPTETRFKDSTVRAA